MSEHQKTTQATLSDLAAPKDHKLVEKFALFLEDGTPLTEVISDLTARIVDLETP